MAKAYFISTYQAVHDADALAALGTNAVVRNIRIIEGV